MVFNDCPSLYHVNCAIVESGTFVINISPKQLPVLDTDTTGKGFMVNVGGES